MPVVRCFNKVCLVWLSCFCEEVGCVQEVFGVLHPSLPPSELLFTQHAGEFILDLLISKLMTFLGEPNKMSERKTNVEAYIALVHFVSSHFGAPILNALHGKYEGHSLCFAIIMFQQHLQPLYLHQFFKETPLSLYTFEHPLKPAVYDTRLRWLGYV